MSPQVIGTLWLLAAIIFDVVSTIYMAKAEGLKNLTPLIIGGILYFGSFITCALALKYMQAGILYVIWAGVGAIATIMLAQIMLQQKLDTAALIGVTFIIIGVTVIANYSKFDI